MSEVEEGRKNLRIDSVSASKPIGSAVNIVRIDTGPFADFKSAKFTEIAMELKESNGQRNHLLATMVYQSLTQLN